MRFSSARWENLVLSSKGGEGSEPLWAKRPEPIMFWENDNLDLKKYNLDFGFCSSIFLTKELHIPPASHRRHSSGRGEGLEGWMGSIN